MRLLVDLLLIGVLLGMVTLGAAAAVVVLLLRGLAGALGPEKETRSEDRHQLPPRAPDGT